MLVLYRRSRLAALVALLLLFAAPASGAIVAATGTLLTANDKSQKSTFAPTTSAALEVGNAGVCVLAVDNISTGGGETTDHTTVTDAASNVWVKLFEASNAGVGAATCTVSVWTTTATTELSSGAAITFNIVSNRAAWAVTCQEFTLSVGDTLSKIDQDFLEGDNSDPATVSNGGLANVEHLFVAGACGETNDGGWSTPTFYTGFDFSSSTTSGGASAANMAARANFRIFTGTGSSHDPSWPDEPDHVHFQLALDELDVVGKRRTIIID